MIGPSAAAGSVMVAVATDCHAFEVSLQELSRLIRLHHPYVNTS